MTPAYVTREEFKVLRSEVEGEKPVIRRILEGTQRNGDGLATLIRKVDGLDSRVESLTSRIGSLESKIGALDAKLTRLIQGLPAIVAEAARKDRGETPRKRCRVRITRAALP